MESNSDCGESEVSYRPRFGFPDSDKIISDATRLGVIQCRKPDDRSNSRIYHIRHHANRKRYDFASIIYNSFLGAVELN